MRRWQKCALAASAIASLSFVAALPFYVKLLKRRNEQQNTYMSLVQARIRRARARTIADEERALASRTRLKALAQEVYTHRQQHQSALEQRLMLYAEQDKLAVVLKLDDLSVEGDGRVAPLHDDFFNMLLHRNVAFGCGLVASCLEEKRFARDVRAGPRCMELFLLNYATDKEGKFNYGIDGSIEVRCHGTTCAPKGYKAEFRGRSYEDQLKSLQRAQTVTMDTLGLVYRSFGAPGNAVDESTGRALMQFSRWESELVGQDGADMVWLFGRPQGYSGIVLQRDIEMERSPTGKWDPRPDAETFMASFLAEEQKLRKQGYVVLQGHPRAWPGKLFGEKEQRWKRSLEDFERILEFLDMQGVVYLTPYQCGEYIKIRGR